MRTAYYEIVELSINNLIVDVIHKHYITQHVMEHITSAPNERVLRTTQLSKLSFNQSSVVLTADVFQHYYKINKPLESAPRGGPSDPKFWWCNNGDILVCHTRCESSSPRRRNEPLGYYFTKILDRMLGPIGAYYRGEADFSFCC